MTKKIIYENFTKEELIEEIYKVKCRLKYGLIWEDTKEDFVKEMRGKIALLSEDKDREINKKSNLTNILIEGDNIHALAALRYTHHKKIDVIYIDPPYNTGAEDWKYNNNYVNKEDTFRHSKWLSFMSHRLKISKDLLKDDGIMCVLIDHNELPRLWQLMDQIFEEKNYLGTVIIRNKPSGRGEGGKIAVQHEYALFFGKSDRAIISKFGKDIAEKSHNILEDEKGYYEPTNLRKTGADKEWKNKSGKIKPNYYPFYFDPKTNNLSATNTDLPETIYPINDRGEKCIWRKWKKEDMEQLIHDGEVWCEKQKGHYQIKYKFRTKTLAESPKSIWVNTKYSATEYGTKHLENILDKQGQFPYPKSPFAVMDCILAASDKKDAIVLDFFAGSGTTGEAVLRLNEKDNGNRQFILATNNENNIIDDATYPRLSALLKKTLKLNNFQEVECDKTNALLDKKTKTRESIGPFNGNLKYFKTTLLDGNISDKNKYDIAKKMTSLICLKENCFSEIITKKPYLIFSNADNTKKIIILYDEDYLNDVETLLPDDILHKIYVFSYNTDGSIESDSFNNKKIEVIPIPQPLFDDQNDVLRGIYET